MKKYILFIISILMLSVLAMAQKTLYVHTIDGGKVEILMSDVAYIGIEDYIPSINANGHEYVDLGLPSGTLWATMNVGAKSPENYGGYYAWGETAQKYSYNWGTYKWCEGDYNTQTKYCTSSSYGTVDNKTILEFFDDVANAQWGGDWRMPTKEEQDELRNECTWDRVTKNSVKGFTVTGPNGNSIFLPAAGYSSGPGLQGKDSFGFYWSRNLDSDYSVNAYCLYFGSSYVNSDDYSRDFGFSIRPVLKAK